MMVYGIITSLILMAAGAITYYVAPLVGPNPLLGVRIGYTYATRDAWDKVNRYAGKLYVAFSACLLLISLISDSTPIFTTGVLVVAIVPGVLGYRKAVRLAEFSGFEREEELAKEVKEVEPQGVSRIYIIMPFLILLVLLIVSVIAYPLLPERVAIHFDAAGNPDGWSDKFGALLISPVMGVVLAFIPLLLVALAKKYPMLFYRGKLKTGQNTVLEIACGAMSFLVVVMLFTQTYAILSALCGTGIWAYNVMVYASAGLLLLWVALKYRKSRTH
jgi:uncharacterized membrane protein